MKAPHAILAASFLLAPLLAACASTYDSAEKEPRGAAKFANDPRLGAEVDKICFAGTINSFSAETRDTVVLRARASDYYLVEVTGGCTSLRNAQRVGVDPRGGSCLRKNDFLIVSENLFNGGQVGIDPQRCMIRSIYEWDREAVGDVTARIEEAVTEN